MPLRDRKLEQVFTGMEIDESLDLHVKSWKIQPIAWSVIGLFILAGVLGLFGTGILSRKTEKKGDISVEYERFFRFGTVMKMGIRDASGGVQTEIVFPSAYLSHYRVESVIPQPSGTEVGEGHVKYIFNSGTKVREVFFYIEPQDAGKLRGLIRVNDTGIDISQIIFP